MPEFASSAELGEQIAASGYRLDPVGFGWPARSRVASWRRRVLGSLGGAGDAVEFEVHPIVHVVDNLPDGMGKAVDGARG